MQQHVTNPSSLSLKSFRHIKKSKTNITVKPVSLFRTASSDGAMHRPISCFMSSSRRKMLYKFLQMRDIFSGCCQQTNLSQCYQQVLEKLSTCCFSVLRSEHHIKLSAPTGLTLAVLHDGLINNYVTLSRSLLSKCNRGLSDLLLLVETLDEEVKHLND